jgi:hypothetical protein
LFFSKIAVSLFISHDRHASELHARKLQVNLAIYIQIEKNPSLGSTSRFSLGLGLLLLLLFRLFLGFVILLFVLALQILDLFLRLRNGLEETFKPGLLTALKILG